MAPPPEQPGLTAVEDKKSSLNAPRGHRAEKKLLRAAPGSDFRAAVDEAKSSRFTPVRPTFFRLSLAGGISSSLVAAWRSHGAAVVATVTFFPTFRLKTKQRTHRILQIFTLAFL